MQGQRIHLPLNGHRLLCDPGHLLRDARQTAGLSVQDLSESLGFSDESLLARIESGESIMPLEPMLRAASLLARLILFLGKQLISTG